MPIVHNIADLERGLSDIARKQIPFAVSVGINDTLSDVKKNTDKRMARILDRPTPFTLRAFRIKRSSKRKLGGSVYAQEAQARYLRFAEDGGERRPDGAAIVIPVRQRLNKYGNMPKGAIKKAIARADTFATAKGSRLSGGVYRRTKRGLQMVAAFVGSASYAERLKFDDTANKTALARFAVNVERAMVRAFKSAK
ncbi:hypothetical protein [Tropicimonas sp. IMCC34043]|uniref:hypothetical protein n=1 Tax=Tropicimonas sp. IMCC34043 TaxID=2248760 RepID=UPI000E24B46B|nr:hypothetical protein [Tropicimonas sp. IMCC34043]